MRSIRSRATWKRATHANARALYASTVPGDGTALDMLIALVDRFGDAELPGALRSFRQALATEMTSLPRSAPLARLHGLLRGMADAAQVRAALDAADRIRTQFARLADAPMPQRHMLARTLFDMTAPGFDPDALRELPATLGLPAGAHAAWWRTVERELRQLAPSHWEDDGDRAAVLAQLRPRAGSALG
ncbi:hypothetical protein [Trinickia mobilis]|uniref:hypothetical protein n=1 Tax=Trinickia mobilis TaxID=2816356 RepID=UPI001A8DDD5F|nr:hypothetical protein [Trinickia mobilis]